MDKTHAELVRYVDWLGYPHITAEAIHSAKRCLIDALGCALGSINDGPIRAIHSVAANIISTNPATIIGSSTKTSPDWAGFVNGAMIRYSDFSDDYFSTNSKQVGPHPSDNIGSVLAAAESTGAGGKSLILGMVVAYEVCGQLVDRVALHLGGWDYPTLHAIATTLGVGKVLKLTPEQLKHALSLAVVSNICLWQTRLGELSNWKGLAGPNGSRNGYISVLLAQHGISGPENPFEGKAGFMKQLDSHFELRVHHEPGMPFKIERTYFKYLPIMYSTQLFVWTAFELNSRLEIDKAIDRDIQSIVVFVSAYHLSIGAFDSERWVPKSRETADHSGPYLIAAALIDGKIDADTMKPSRYLDRHILDLARKITVEEDREYSAVYPQIWNCRLEATLRSGKVVTAHHSFPKGHPANPMNDQEIETKFIGQADNVLGTKRCRDIIDAIWNLERLQSVESLLHMMQVP